MTRMKGMNERKKTESEQSDKDLFSVNFDFSDTRELVNWTAVNWRT